MFSIYMILILTKLLPWLVIGKVRIKQEYKVIESAKLNELSREKINNLYQTKSDTNRPVQSQKLARSLELWI